MHSNVTIKNVSWPHLSGPPCTIMVYCNTARILLVVTRDILSGSERRFSSSEIYSVIRTIGASTIFLFYFLRIVYVRYNNNNDIK